MTQLLEALGQELKYTIRGLRRSVGFTAAVVLTLGLGVGANVAMFSLVDHLMFRPFAYLRDPDTVHRIYLQTWERGVLRTGGGEYTRFLDIRKWTTSFSHYAGFANHTMAVGVGDASRERRVAQVSATFFDFFEARPRLGRFFTADEDTIPRGADVAVLGYAFWKSELGGRNVLGEVLHVGNIPATIIGVAPEGFAGVMDDAPPAVYIPITTYAGAQPRDARTYYTHYGWGWMQTMVRRKPGVTIEQASADASIAHRNSWEAERQMDPSVAPAEIARPHAVVGPMKVAAGPNPSLEARTALWLAAVAVIVLLIACANVANLMLARALKRQGETAVRLALGVSRRRLMMQSLTESLALALAGSALGLLVADWGGAAIRHVLVSRESVSLNPFTDWRTLGAATGVALAAAVLTGVGPALLSGRGDLARLLRSGSRSGTRHGSGLRIALLITQGALCVVLLVGAGLFVRSLNRVTSMRTGYDVEDVLHVSRNLRGLELDSSRLVRLHDQLLTRAQAIPVVEHAALARTVPFWSTATTALHVPGIDSVRRLGSFTYQTATTDYFRVMGTRILRGRGFTSSDREGAPRVAVVSEGMATTLWPGKDALGQCIRVGSDRAPCSTVVGIAEDMLQRDVMNDKRYQYYLPLGQYQPHRGQFLLLKLRGDPGVQGEEVRKALQPLMPGHGYIVVRPMREALDQAYRSWQLGATMFVAFGVLALIVAAVGLYGVIGYHVTQRMHELAVRVALGAQAGDIFRAVVGQGVRFAIAGITLGSLLALLGANWLQPLLFKQSARDPLIYGIVGAVVILVALVATAFPAARAARADPNAALRAE